MNNRSIQLGKDTITYEVIRSERRKKTIHTKVTPDGVRVLAPFHTTDRRLEELIRKQAGWILKQREILQAKLARRFVTGDTLPYLGQDIELVVDTDQFSRPWIRFHDGRFLFDAPPGIDQEARRELIIGAFADWYRDQAAEYLPERVGHWLPFVASHQNPKVLIGNQRSRWASCSSDSVLRFSWRVMMVDPELIDYLVVHELTHLTVMNHSPLFWESVSFVMPDAKDRNKRLDEAGLLLPF